MLFAALPERPAWDHEIVMSLPLPFVPSTPARGPSKVTAALCLLRAASERIPARARCWREGGAGTLGPAGNQRGRRRGAGAGVLQPFLGEILLFRGAVSSPGAVWVARGGYPEPASTCEPPKPACWRRRWKKQGVSRRSCVFLPPHLHHGAGTTASSSSPQEHAVEVAGRSGGPEAEPGGPWDAVRIVAPRCEVYVCVGRADGAAR